MSTNRNSSRLNGSPLFKYARPAFNGYEFDDEPDKRVTQEIREMLSLLDKGFNDNKVKDAEYDKLVKEKERLENEKENGIGKSLDDFKKKIDEVFAADSKVDETKDILNNLEEQVNEVKEEITFLREKLQQHQKNNERIQRTHADGTASNNDHDTEVPIPDLEEQINKAEGKLLNLENQRDSINQSLSIAKTDLKLKISERQKVKAEYDFVTHNVKDELDTVLRKIKEVEELKDDRKYGDIFSLDKLNKLNVGKTKFKNKIGRSYELNSLFIVVEDKLTKSRLSFNASIFLKHELVLEFLFLRTFFKDGLRDADAIFDRIIDETEGGIKYLYDYIIEKVVKQIVEDKKLKS